MFAFALDWASVASARAGLLFFRLSLAQKFIFFKEKNFFNFSDIIFCLIVNIDIFYISLFAKFQNKHFWQSIISGIFQKGWANFIKSPFKKCQTPKKNMIQTIIVHISKQFHPTQSSPTLSPPPFLSFLPALHCYWNPCWDLSLVGQRIFLTRSWFMLTYLINIPNAKWKIFYSGRYNVI